GDAAVRRAGDPRDVEISRAPSALGMVTDCKRRSHGHCPRGATGLLRPCHLVARFAYDTPGHARIPGFVRARRPERTVEPGVRTVFGRRVIDSGPPRMGD